MKDSVGSGWTPQARIRTSQFVHWKCCVVRGNVIQFETTRAFPNSRTVLFLNPWSRLNPSRWFQRPENQYQCLLFAMIFKKTFHQRTKAPWDRQWLSTAGNPVMYCRLWHLIIVPKIAHIHCVTVPTGK